MFAVVTSAVATRKVTEEIAQKLTKVAMEDKEVQAKGLGPVKQ